jgi:hypothetical protein
VTQRLAGFQEFFSHSNQLLMLLRQSKTSRCFAALLVIFLLNDVNAQNITANGHAAQLNIRKAGENSIRITLKPVDFKDDFPLTLQLLIKLTRLPKSVFFNYLMH